MGTDAEQLRREIEQTRQELTYDADALTEKVSPARIMDRRVGRAKNALTNAKEKVMGSASDASHSSQSTLSSAASGVADSTSDLAGSAKQRAQGNPLAAGLMAFGAGWLVSALIPASQREQQAAGQLVDAAREHSQPLTENLGQIAGEIKDNMQEPAQQAAQAVSDTASEAAENVKNEGRSAAESVKSDSQRATENVRLASDSGSNTGTETRYTGTDTRYPSV
ncbi:MAG: DUF3618 domain-containing protein [Geodermatophilaceae bacterium]|nr:DUF3618 domain-containing protein [Geodermatophilaceae bacterium]MDQ3464635.1 DUF3618 domain-containing protein [Actinomycetota bacterium]